MAAANVWTAPVPRVLHSTWASPGDGLTGSGLPRDRVKQETPNSVGGVGG